METVCGLEEQKKRLETKELKSTEAKSTEVSQVKE